MSIDDRIDTGHPPLDAPSSTVLRPHYEGANIGSWIGFKHVNYLVEEAVLEHLRGAGWSARRLFEDYGLGVEFVDLDTRIRTAAHLDDPVLAEVVPRSTDGALEFTITLDVPRENGPARAATATARVLLRAEPAGSIVPPPELAGAVVERLSHPAEPVPSPPGTEPLPDRLVHGHNAIGWSRSMPYIYCHFSERVQLSGYLRQLEEVVEIFLAARGISIATMLDERRWIPVVPHSRVRVLDEALMEEELVTVFTVEQVFKRLTYTARMDCYVERAGRVIPVATGTITHGYAHIENRSDWRLVDFDDRVLAALRGELEPGPPAATGRIADGAGSWTAR